MIKTLQWIKDLFSSKTLLTYCELEKLVNDGVITAKHENINPASIDVTVHNVIRIENQYNITGPVDLSKKENIGTTERVLDDKGYILAADEVILASTVERFNLPDNIVAEFVLKSSQARNFLNHMLAGYCDPGWNNSRLTLEYKNTNRFHELLITPGMKAGQVKFYRVKRVPRHKSYAVTGQYNGQEKVQQSKGIQ